MNESYYNTTGETGGALNEYEERAQSQEAIILEHFQSCLGEYTPSEINRALLPSTPITSIRRALCVLTEKGRLTKTEIKRRGMFGRPEHAWKLSDDEVEAQLDLPW